MRHTLRFNIPLGAVSVLAAGAAAAVLVACGGGYSSGSSSATGCGSGYNVSNCAAPTITMSSPGSTVHGTVALTASASAATGASVTRVDFMVDGTVVGTATASPYSFNWDSTTVGDGSHQLTSKVTDNMSQTTTSAALAVSVQNTTAFNVTLAATQIFPAPTTSATGTANLTVKLANGATSGKVTLTGLTATAVSINQAFAGATGASVITLTANAGTADEWDVPAAALLTADQVTALMKGQLYVIANSAANPSGELRGQILPANVTVNFAAAAGSQETPAVAINASGVVATTVDSVANTLSVHLNSTGVNDATAAELDTAAAGATGPKLVALTKDSVNMGRWSIELASVTAADVTNFSAGKWYVNVVTPADPNGAIRGQINGSATPPPAAPTLTQLQASVFNVCTGCHTGTGTTLPGSMNLTAGHTFASIVGVASVEQSNLKRVAPGSPDTSYVVQKLEGAASISGSRMPLGGPFFDQATIDQVRAWISAGAQNN
jgi:hypothetical protein